MSYLNNQQRSIVQIVSDDSDDEEYVNQKMELRSPRRSESSVSTLTPSDPESEADVKGRSHLPNKKKMADEHEELELHLDESDTESGNRLSLQLSGSSSSPSKAASSSYSSNSSANSSTKKIDQEVLSVPHSSSNTEHQSKTSAEDLANARAEDNDQSEPKTEEKSNTNNEEDGEEKTYDVEKIIAHKKIDNTDYYRIRWTGYGPKDDTWEPYWNVIGDTTLNMIKEFMEQKEEKKRQMTAKRKETAQKRKSQIIEKKEEASGDEGELNESWYGIKQGQGPRETQRLFVADRVLTETEKLLAESKPGERIFRHQVKAQITPGKSASPAASQVIRSQKSAGKKRGRPSQVEKESREPPGPSIPRIDIDDIFTSESSPLKSPEKETPAITEQKKPSKKVTPLKVKRKPNKLAQKISKEKEVPAEKMPESSTESRPQKIESDYAEKKAVVQKHKKPDSSAESQPQKTESEYVEKKPTVVVQKPASVKSEEGETQKAKRPKKTAQQKQATEKPNKRAKDTTAHSEISPVAFLDSIEQRSKRERLTARDDRSSISLPILGATTDLGAYIGELSKSAQAKTAKVKLPQIEFEEAVMDGKVDKVRAALDGDSEIDLNRILDDFGQTLLHKLCEMKCNVNHAACELIDILVKRGAKMGVRETQNGNIPLHIAIANRRICHVRKLISLRSPLNMVNFSNQPPIVVTLDCKDDAFIDALLNAGASYQPVFKAFRDDKPPPSRHLLNKNVNPHQKKLQEAFDAARIAVCQNMAVVRNVSPIFVNPLYESPDIEHTFRCDVNLPGPNHCYIVFTCVSEFYPEKAVAKMWGPSPVKSVSVNGVVSVPVLPDANGYVFFCHTRTTGMNSLRIKLDPSDSISTLKLLTQVAFVQLVKDRPVAPIAPMASAGVRNQHR